MEKKEVKTVEKLTGKELFEKNGKTILENEDESWIEEVILWIVLDKADHETGEDGRLDSRGWRVDDHVLMKEEEEGAEEEEAEAADE